MSYENDSSRDRDVSKNKLTLRASVRWRANREHAVHRREFDRPNIPKGGGLARATQVYRSRSSNGPNSTLSRHSRASASGKPFRSTELPIGRELPAATEAASESRSLPGKTPTRSFGPAGRSRLIRKAGRRGCKLHSSCTGYSKPAIHSVSSPRDTSVTMAIACECVPL